MSSGDPRDYLDEIRRNDRYFLAILLVFVLSLLLVFYKELDLWIQKQFVPTLIVYLIGTALIAQVQNMVGNRERLRNEAAGKPFVGSSAIAFRIVVLMHICWFFGWIAFLLFHAPLAP